MMDVRTVISCWLLLVLITSACDQDSCPTCDHFPNGYVIGFDPCTGVLEPNSGEVGFNITIPSRGDTVVAYNFPAGVYEFPTRYFEDYEYIRFFPDSAAKSFPIRLKYREVNEKHRTYPVCRGDIVTNPPLKEISIISITR